MAHGGALVVLPVALGGGLPLFRDLAEPLRLDLAEARTFPDGTVIHVDQPIRSTGNAWTARRPLPDRPRSR